MNARQRAALKALIATYEPKREALPRRVVRAVKAYRDLRQHHSRRYSARVAYDIAMWGSPF